MQKVVFINQEADPIIHSGSSCYWPRRNFGIIYLRIKNSVISVAIASNAYGEYVEFGKLIQIVRLRDLEYSTVIVRYLLIF